MGAACNMIIYWICFLFYQYERTSIQNNRPREVEAYRHDASHVLKTCCPRADRETSSKYKP